MATITLVLLQWETKSIKYRIKIYLSPGNKGVKVKSSANIAPTAHMSANFKKKASIQSSEQIMINKFDHKKCANSCKIPFTLTLIV